VRHSSTSPSTLPISTPSSRPFDNDDPRIFNVQTRFVREARIVHTMVNMLVAVPKTPLHARLLREGRLDLEDVSPYGTNVIPLRMTREELADAEVARRAGLAERRYGHYVRGTREPDFATLMRICAVLSLTPNDLLLDSDTVRSTAKERWLARLTAAGRKLEADDVKLAARQIEALAEHRATAKRVR
jgi:transcriptional regulator with XRE-family HTH domain